MAGPDGKFLWSFGSRGSGPGQLRGPEGIAAGADGRIYVADTGNDRVQIYTPEGIFLYSLSGTAPGKAFLRRPVRVSVDPSDNVYVLTSGGSQILKFGPNGGFIKEIQAQGSAFCVDDYGFIYVLDTRNGKIKELGPKGNLLGTFGTYGTGPGQFSKPTDISVDPSGYLLVSDSANKRVAEFRLENKLKTAKMPLNNRTKINLVGPTRTWPFKAGAIAVSPDFSVFAYLPETRELALINKDGKLVRKFGQRGKEPGQTYEPRALIFDSKKGLFVADTGNDRVQIFSSTGELVGTFGEKSAFFGGSSKEGRMSSPAGITITEKGTLYVADTRNARVQAFSPEGIFLFAIGPKLDKYVLREPVDVQWDPSGFVYILDRRLRQIFKTEPSGKFVSAWGRTGPGNREWEDPAAMAYDNHSFLYVLDKKTARLKLFDTYGDWVTNFFAKGTGEKDLAEPASLAFAGNSVVISDPGNSRIMAFDIRPVLAPPAAITAKAKEGRVSLAWASADRTWVSKYHIFRSSSPEGPFVEAAAPAEMTFSEAPPETHATWYYQMAAEAKTGDTGFMSQTVAVFVPGSVNVAPVELEKIDLGYIFSSNYKYYLKNPVGKLSIANNTDSNFTNVKLSFTLKDFMDFSYDTVIESLPARKKTGVPLMATLNNRILDVSEDTPIQAQFRLTWYDQGREQTITLNKPVKVLSRNAILWDRTERLANFITPKDPPVFNFGRAALLMKPKSGTAAANLNANLSSVLAIWSAAGELGISFMVDPSNPYSRIKSSQELPLDTVQMPRDTLKLKSGECDDLTAFFATIFEGAGLHAAFLDYPGHIAVMFDTGVSDPMEAGLPEERMIKYKDTWWIPVEATMAGKPFADANRQAASTYRNAGKDVKIADIHDAWAEFEPVTLPETNWESPVPDKEGLLKRFREDAENLGKMRYDFLKSRFTGMAKKNPEEAGVGLGILEAQYGNADAAKSHFDKVLAGNPQNAAALNNLGNLGLSAGQYEKAGEFYLKASQADPYDAGIWMNRARAAVKSGNKANAKAFAAKGAELDPGMRDTADALLSLK
ncbi:MAG: hypothetical protein ABIG11_06890 [bacterium]